MPDTPAPLTLEDETGRHYVVLDTRNRRKLWRGLTTWQWAVIGAWVTSVVLSGFLGFAIWRVRSNSERLNDSICAQAVYLDGTKARDPIGQARIDNLVRDLRALNPDCPPGPPERPAPPG